MIDIHCHVLPGIDDGAPDLDVALDMARLLVADGVTHVVATPHVYPGRFDNDLSSIESALLSFRQVLISHRIPLTISAGSEVRLCSEILPLLQAQQIPCIGESNGLRNMLLEFPDAQIPVGADKLVAYLLRMKIRPVLVHPERNKAVMEKPDRLRPFVEMGCSVQVTAGSLAGQFGPRVFAATLQLLENGWVDAVASDAHNVDGRRPRMRDARAELADRYGEALATELTLTGPGRLCGLDVVALERAHG